MRKFLKVSMLLLMVCLAKFSIAQNSNFPQKKRTALWLKAHEVEYDTAGGNVVTYWGDESTKGTNSMDSVYGGVQYVRSGLNMHPAVSYTTASQYVSAKGFQFGNPKSGEMFLVMQSKASSNLATTGQRYPLLNWGVASGDEYTWNNYNTYNGFGSSARKNWAWNSTTYSTSGYDPLYPSIINISSKPNSWAYSQQTYVTGIPKQHNFSTTSNTVYWNTSLAAPSKLGNGFIGDIYEVIVFDTALNLTERRKVRTYLSVKYGMMMDSIHYSSDGAVIFNPASVGTQKYQVFSIGRDDAMGLNQKQSGGNDDIDGTGLIIGIGNLAGINEENASTFTTDKSFFSWSHNFLAPSYRTSLAGPSGISVNNRITRIWKATEVGSMGKVTVALPSAMSFGDTVYMVVSTDSSFSSADKFVMGVLKQIDGVNYYVFEYDFSNGDYFTFATDVKAPGGVASGLAWWFAGDKGVFADNKGNVYRWQDLGPNGLDVKQNSAANRPKIVVKNFNNALRFSGSQTLGSSIGLYKLNTAYTAYTDVIAAYNNSTTSYLSLYGEQVRIGAANTAAYYQFLNLPNDGTQLRWGVNFSGTSTLYGNYTNATSAYTTQILSGVYNAASTPKVLSLNLNGSSGATPTTGAVTFYGNNGPLYIGSIGASTNYFNGIGNELIHYDRALTATEINKVESYLAIKWGKPLNSSYLASSGDTIWSLPRNSPYKRYLVGIGRDDASGLDQRMSNVNRVNSTLDYAGSDDNKLFSDLVTIGLDTITSMNSNHPKQFSKNLSFLLWGCDNGSVEYIRNISGSTGIKVNKRLQRVYKVWEKGTVGTVMVKIPSMIKQGQKAYLVISSDTSFTSADKFVELKNLNDDDFATNYMYAKVDFTNGDYFTIATFKGFPGGVSNKLGYWFTPTEGLRIINENHNYIELLDLSGSGFHMEREDWAVAATNGAPKLKYVNFNKSLDYDGANDGLWSNKGSFWSGRAAGSVTEYSQLVSVSWPESSTRTILGDYNSLGYFVNWNWQDYYHVGVYNGAGRSNGPYTTTPWPSINLGSNITSTQYKSTATQVRTLFNNGANVATTLNTASAFGASASLYSLALGGRSAINAAPDAWFWKGAINEVIMFDRSITDAERLKVESYLSVKWGRSLTTTATYYTSNYGKIWDPTKASSGYNNFVTAIGRDDNGALYKRQSRNQVQFENNYFYVAAALNTFAETENANSNEFTADTSFMTFGYDNTNTVGWQVTESFRKDRWKLNREWFVQEKGTVGSVTLRIPAQQGEYAGTKLPPTAGNAKLWVDNDGNFGAGVTEYEMQLVDGNWEVKIDLSNGQYFTFATYTDSSDFDGDKVADIYDIDDDNDGLLDKEEGQSPRLIKTTDVITTALKQSFTSKTASGTTSIDVKFTDVNQASLLFANGNDRAQEFRIYDTDRSNAAYNYKFDAHVESVSKLHNVVFRPASVNIGAYSNEAANITLKWRGGIPAIVRNPSGQINIANGSIIYPNTAITQSAGIATSALNWSIEFLLDDTAQFDFSAEVYLTATTNSAYEVWAIGTTLSDDIDGDGKPNKRDLDADGDGCFDAYEGSIVANKTTSLVSSPFGTNGYANSLETADLLTAEAKNMSTVYVALSKDINMCADSDNDGIVDLKDIDDDNDGVLDIVELACDNSLSRIEGTLAIASALPSGSNNIWGYFINNQDTVDFKVRFSNMNSFTVTNTDQGSGVHFGTFDNDAAGYQEEFILNPIENEVSQHRPGFSKIEYGPNVPKNTIYGTQTCDKQFIISKWYPNVPAYIYDPQGQTKNGHMSVFKNGDTLFTTADRTVATSTWKIVYDANRYDDSFYINNIHVDLSGANISYESFGLSINTCTYQDQDRDFIPNNLDLDSDGDGCYDAFESSMSANSSDSVLTGPFGNNGYKNNLETNDSITAVSKIKTTYNRAINSDVSMCVDSDADGVKDVIDLDDDNDGILDYEETNIAGATFVQNGTPVTTVNKQEINAYAQNGSAKAFVKIVYSAAGTALTASTVQYLDGLHYVISDNDAAFSQTIRVTPEFGSILNEVRFGPNMPKNPNSTVSNDIQKIRLSWNPDVVGIVVDPNNQIANYATGDTIAAGAILNFTSAVTTSNATWYVRYLTVNMPIEFFLVASHQTTAASFSTEAYGLDMDLGFLEDTDDDKICDYLDKDSDNDGCGDAQESGAVVSGNTVPSPYGNNGLSSSIENNDTKAASTTFASTSYLAYAGTNGCGDTDNDGVRDIDDIDDDNDGITDYNELDCGQGTFAKSYLLNYPTDKAIGGNFGFGNLITTSQIRFKNLTSLTSASDATEGVHYLINESDKTYDLSISMAPVSSTALNSVEFAPFFAGSTNGATNNANQEIILNWNPGVVAYVYDPNNQLSSHGNGVPIKPGAKLIQNAAAACSTLTWKVVFYTNYIAKPFKIDANFTTSAASFSAEGYTLKVHLCNGKKDSDRDGKLNSIDKDSDGDGCSDAVEAGHLKTTSYSDQSITGPFGVNGLSALVENSDSIYAINNYIPASWYLDKKQNYCLDTDGDKINDMNDLDDDNDGILDQIECPTKVKTTKLTWLVRERNSKRIIYDLLNSDGDTISKVTFDAVKLISFAGANITSDNTFTGEIIDLGAGATIPRIFTAKFEPVSSKAINLSIFMKEGGNGRFFFHPRSVKWDYGTAGMGIVTSIPQPKYLKEKYKAGDTLVSLKPVTTAHNGLDASTNKEFINVLVTGNATKEKPLIITSNYYPLAGYFGGENYAFRVLDIEMGETTSVACDTDNDGIPDSLDPDSDGDGCRDVVEAGHFKFVKSTVDTIPGKSGKNGFSELVETNDSMNTQSNYVNLNCWQNKNIQICNDNDKDGIIDYLDIDDDNDGITDDNECPLPNLVSNSDFEGQTGSDNLLNGVAGPGWIKVTGTPDLWTTPVPKTGTGITAATNGYADGMPSSPSKGNFVGASDISVGGESFKRTISGLVVGAKYRISFYYANAGLDGNTKVGDEGRVAWDIHTDITGSLKESFRTPFLSYLGEGKQIWNYYQVEFTATKTSHILQFSADNGLLNEPASTTNIRYAAIDGVRLSKADRYCDADGDGKPNVFDLDSDGDGCFDALESGHNKPVNPDGTINGPFGDNGLATSVEKNDKDTTSINYVLIGDYQNSGIHIPCDSYIKQFTTSNGACSDTIFAFDINFTYYNTSNKYIVYDLTRNVPIDTFVVASAADLPHKVKYKRQMSKKEDVVFYTSDFTEKRIVSNMDTISIDVCNKPKPKIKVIPATGASCSSDSVRMSVKVSAAGISSWNYQWYKDGTKLSGKTDSTLRIKKTTATDAGKYYAKVGETINDTLWSDTVNLIIYAKPKAKFGVNDTLDCVPVDAIVFKDSSSITSGTLSYAWNFDDGTTSTAQNPTHSYGSTALGTRKSRLIVTSNNGCKDTAYKNIQVGKDPTSSFTVNNNSQCLGSNNLITTNSSTVAAGSGTPRYKWEFGNGDTSNLFEPKYKYKAAGTYTIKLTTISGQGCKINSTSSIIINDGPLAKFRVNYDTQCLSGNSFVHSDLSTLVASTSHTYKYFFGDKGKATIAAPTHTYSAVGAYKDTLVVTTASTGCSDTFIKTLYVVNNIAAPNIVNLGADTLYQTTTQLTVNPYNSSYTYTWNTGVVNDTLTVDTTGTYSVTVSTPSGCSATSNKISIYDITGNDDSDGDGIKNKDEKGPNTDTDGDGIPDYLDLDSDNDGIPDATEKGSGTTPVDTDKDGTPDFQDLDSDGDGISDATEKGSGSTPVDSDGDGTPDYLDLDSDGDGINDAIEGATDTDGDGIPNYIDTDSDGDGILDSIEKGSGATPIDTDADGTPDYLDLDSDGDGISDNIEKGSGATPVDTDGDGTPDYRDLDSDGDGILDSIEKGSGTTPADTDGDGIYDFREADSDNDGISDATEKGSGATPVDTDGDGKPDFQDLDSDDDGILDSLEKGSGSTPVDTDSDGEPDYLDIDSDGDGISDSTEKGSGSTPVDTDADGTPDYRDLDSDEDGIKDAVEGTTDADTDSKPNYVDTDSDGDGILDSVEKGSGTSPVDSDSDGTPDYLDLDSDGDGILDSIEKGASGTSPVDTDGDGTPDYKDLDSDGDGITDSMEGETDTDGDGKPNYIDTDSDGDGITDATEGSVDTDGDNKPDYLDTDSDGDGISDATEGTTDTDGDGKPNYKDTDSDGDGILDSVEKGSGATPVDTDSDGTPDYLDTDSDGDGISDATEGTTDTDGDGKPNYIDTDSDGDGISDATEGTTDSDGDGKPNYLDTDSDGDGILDSTEGTIDTDGDGKSNYLDTDSDGDGILDSVEGTTDTDGDGKPNYLDLDSDGDGIPDSIEGTTDSDGDGKPNYLDTDSDGDGISDATEAGVDPTKPVDTDADGTPDYKDLDSDADGISDATEGTTDTDGDGKPNYLDTDSDGDGISDNIEGIIDTDGDGKPNYLDTDSDGDGISDAIEKGSGTTPIDSDGDGKPDYLDTDSDNDGILDSVEKGSGTTPVDTDADGKPDYLDLDSDGDGIIDATEGATDTDGDGKPNFQDSDSDGDGLTDATEGTIDTDGDGKPNYLDTDSDGDGILDSVEGTTDTDGDGKPNYLDTDSDGDGILDSVEGTTDTDGDGKPNYIDTDSDGDGISDATEGVIDTDGDGKPNYLDTDSDGDGISDNDEKGSGTTPVDTDNDGTPDYLDLDSDNDGITDANEKGSGSTPADTDGDGTPDFRDLDSDGDGILDSVEKGTGTTPVDTDGDGTPDFRDVDSDGDGISDAVEGTTDTDGDGKPNYLDSDSDGDGISDATEGNTDTDGDGKPNYLDTDSDGDGILDSTEGTTDTDGDGIPNYKDTDSDGDGITDKIEGTTDTDGDGKPNYLDTDSDGDGISDATEGTTDTDGDGKPNYLDTDSDGDGLSDAAEGTGDADGDGIPDYLDADSDNDGISDATEGTGDTDGDGIPNYLDTDSDGDGISDKIEGVTDTDGDGKPNYLDTDSDGDGILDKTEGITDTDGDGKPNYIDTDSDGDGISDAIEGTTDTDGDGKPNYLDTDSDGDGISDATEGLTDTDGDGKPNYLDTDSDGDGISDATEGVTDTDGDGKPNYLDTDSDGDGILDSVEGTTDTDGDGKPNYLDTDSDGDGISDATEGTVDTDGDGKPNYLDLDSDNDGITDAIEGTTDTDGDGTPNYLDTDSDGDGILDSVEKGSGATPLDSDADGTPDYLDTDSDNDGISDKIEGATDTDSDGKPDYIDTDSDGDGILDSFEKGSGASPVDTDGDGTPDYKDTDSDGDGISDATEGTTDTDADGIPNYRDTDSDSDGILDKTEGVTDTDGDGKPNYLDTDSDGDGISDNVEKGSGATPIDTDADGTPDYLDIDSDNDGISDSIEKGSGSTPVDTDGDGTPDYLDTDSDGDGISDATEGTVDTDGDGKPNYVDVDSDGDGILDSVEGTTDTDGDGKPNYLDTDSDGDGISDAIEGTVDTDGDGKPNYLDTDSDGDGINDSIEKGSGSTPVDTDADGTPDYLDLDSDNDGILDSIEKGPGSIPVDTNADGKPDYLDTDSDGDGISDSTEKGSGSTPIDTDADGKPDYLDLDSDNDGIDDLTEGIADTDGDGKPNYQDTDSDNDGIPDSVEKGIGAKPVDTDADGTPDYLDTDSDNDGISDAIEAGSNPAKPVDTDADGTPDYIDLDSDNDGILDKTEGITDTDGDGTPNYQDIDSDSDGISDAIEKGSGLSPVDTDGDGIQDYLDSDSDNDGISDKIEGTIDTDADGKPDYLDLDSDNDGISDATEKGAGSTPVDTDGDGIADFRDLDSDNDGISDANEGTVDTDGDGKPNYQDIDSDGDGIPDSIEKGTGSNPIDTDGDGKPDYLDLDSDNDGISDNIEAGLNPNSPVDTDGDGIADYRDLDSDNDGITDNIEGVNDTDGDGKPNYQDVDSDADGIPDSVEKGSGSTPVDTDADGTPDYLDKDSDNDGISDSIEAGSDPTKPIDTDADGTPDYLDIDSDGDGISDNIEKGPGANPLDTDADGTPDYRDLDSDNDGILDSNEGATDTDNDGVADFRDLDSDGDGILDATEKGSIAGTEVDTDADGTPDYKDLDSDGDGISDAIEGTVDTDGDGKPDYLDTDSDNDGIIDSLEGNVDTDGDGTADWRDLDSDNDGILDSIEGSADKDGDGKGNWRDLDSDGDGIPDSIEKGPSATPVDTDSDGTPDYLDLDSDNDGIPDAIEKGINGNSPVDTDGDGTPDYLDLDSDNDGISDSIEKGPDGNNPLDSDGDGIYDFREVDSDGDGILDSQEAGKDPKNPVDTDGDGTPDYRDIDSDNDGINDDVEVGPDPKKPVDTDGDGTPDILDTDSDNDGLPDSQEGGSDPKNPLDTDGDGIPDFQDLDSDNDGVLDKKEFKGDCDGDGIPNNLDSDACEPVIPDGFSPNDDGANDKFVIPGIEAYKNNSVKIFNRWGNVVFEATGYQNQWDGTTNKAFGLLESDGRVPDGTYFYIIDLGDGSMPRSGNIYINRIK
jgi:gliding motility-associated-like protein